MCSLCKNGNPVAHLSPAPVVVDPFSGAPLLGEPEQSVQTKADEDSKATEGRYLAMREIARAEADEERRQVFYDRLESEIRRLEKQGR